MKSIKRRLSGLAVLLLALLMLTVPVFAAGMGTLYHPPAVTILTENAPRDLEITILLHGSEKKQEFTVHVELDKKTRAWEQQFRLIREAVYSFKAWFGNSVDLKDAELILSSGGEEKTILLPRELTDQMSSNDILMLNYKAGTVSLGMPFWRGPLVLILRSVIAAAIVLLIFVLRSYVEKRTMILMPLIALVGYGLLNWSTANWLNVDPRSIVKYMIYAMLVIVVQVLAAVVLLDEDSGDGRLSTTLLANLPAMAFNSLALAFLPQ